MWYLVMELFLELKEIDLRSVTEKCLLCSLFSETSSSCLFFSTNDLALLVFVEYFCVWVCFHYIWQTYAM